MNTMKNPLADGYRTYKYIAAERRTIMRGYYVNSGYMGLVDGSFRLFASESDYKDYMEDEQ